MPTRLAQRVLLIGWDAADWKVIHPLMDQGQMPNLAKLIASGVMGDMATMSPPLSPMLWTSVATGKRASKHGILGFVEPDGEGGVRNVSSTSRTCKAIWNILGQSGLRSTAIGWWASHPAEPIQGVVVTDRYPHTIGEKGERKPMPEGTVHPPELAGPLDELRCHPLDLPGEALLEFVPEGRDIDQSKDKRFPILAKLLAEGVSIHNAATWLMENQPWDLLGVYYDSIDHFCHGFMEYHPPQLPQVKDADFARYKGVINAVYRWHDMMLGRLMELAGPDTHILLLSDHGFHSDHLRPHYSPDDKKRLLPVTWHRSHGIFVAAGPGFKRDEHVFGTSLLDITPTILALLGLPIGRDMDGKCLTQLFAEPPAPAYIDSYEPPAEHDGMHRGEVVVESPWEAHQRLQQLAALGYIDAPGEDKEKFLKHAEAERWSNLGQVHYSAGEYVEALAAFEKVRAVEDTRFAKLSAANCLMRLGRSDEAHALVEAVLAENPEAPVANVLLGTIKLNRFEFEEGLDLLLKAEQAQPNLPNLHVQIGQVYLRQRRWTDAVRAFRKALEIDDDNPQAHDGLGVALRQSGQVQEAVSAHMRSVGLLHHQPQAHINLGIALAAAGQIDWAIQAFKVASELAPANPVPHRCLARLFRQQNRDLKQAVVHARQARALRRAAPGRRMGVGRRG